MSATLDQSSKPVYTLKLVKLSDVLDSGVADIAVLKKLPPRVNN